MLKRMNKIISLTLLGATLCALQPIGVSASTVRLESKDGTINKAYAYKGGNIVFDGNKTDDDDTGLYFYNGSYKPVSDYEDASLGSKFGTKYVVVSDKDDYLLDLGTGKVNDNDSVEDMESDAKNSLYKAMKKVDKYDISSADDFDSFERVESDSLTDTMYTFKFGDSLGIAFSNGKYIDLTSKAGLYAYSSLKGDVVKVDDFGTYKNAGLETKLDSFKVIGSNKNSIYVLSTITIEDTKSGDSTTRDFIQVVSSSTTKGDDDESIPSSITSYEINNGVYDVSKSEGVSDILDSYKFAVSDKGIVAYSISSGTITAKTIDLVKEKAYFKVVPTGYTSSSKLSINVVESKESDTLDLKADDSYSIDVDGSVWGLSKGKIYKFNGEDFEQVLACDGAYNAIDVYDKSNLIVWDTDGDSFATLANSSSGANNGNSSDSSSDDSGNTSDSNSNSGSDSTTGTNQGGTVDDSTVKFNEGWNKVGTVWMYYNSSNQPLTNSWVKSNTHWYYLDSFGKMLAGEWVQSNGNWYYLNNDGTMLSGWLNDKGVWYYLGSAGAMQTGWVTVNGIWYYLNSNGSMAYNTTINGYKLSSSGAWVK